MEELSLFDPDGRSGHLFLWIEKRGLGTPQLVRRLADALDLRSEDIGTAGLKDSRAVTRQWVSIPKAAEPRLHLIDDDESIDLLRVESNSGKLRTGELAGNRFRLRLRGADGGAVERWLNESGSTFPNYFGRQRFGHELDTHLQGFALLRGERRGKPGRMTRLALSAAQAALFNAVLAERVETGSWDSMLDGDVLLRRNGNDFHGTGDAAREAVAARRAFATGPMFGPHMKPAGGCVADLESRALQTAGLTDTDFTRYRKLTAGTRRPLVAWMGDAKVEETEGDPLLLFTLPPGSYATVVLEAMGVMAA